MPTEINKPKGPTNWNDTFFLFDIEVIDNQHVVLFELFDLLTESNANGNELASISKIIDDLDDYAHYHLETEESLMKKAMTKDIESHLQQHVFFRNQVKEFRRMYEYQNQSLADLMIDFLRKWFLIHIHDVDRQYVESVKRYMSRCIKDK